MVMENVEKTWTLQIRVWKIAFAGFEKPLKVLEQIHDTVVCNSSTIKLIWLSYL